MLIKVQLFILIVLVSASLNGVLGQTPQQADNDSIVSSWVQSLYEPGLKITEDTIIISLETQRLIESEDYRKLAYPPSYSWDITKGLIKLGKLKMAFWYLINLYSQNEENRSIVLKSIITYDKLFRMDEVLVSVFYTYCYLDPEIGYIKNGEPIITAPQILDEKFQSVKEIIYYLDKYKSQLPKD